MAGCDQSSTAVLFYFDFSSPYSYLVANRIDPLCARYGREVDWRPILLGIVFRQTGNGPITEQPIKGDYARRDMHRCARGQNLPFMFPETFPFASVPAARVVHWLKRHDEALAHEVSRALFAAAFGAGQDISTVEAVIDIAGRSGVGRDDLVGALKDHDVKLQLRQEVDSAIAAGVCGAPFFVADSEPFWGADRLDHLEQWLATGGW